MGCTENWITGICHHSVEAYVAAHVFTLHILYMPGDLVMGPVTGVGCAGSLSARLPLPEAVSHSTVQFAQAVPQMLALRAT